MFEQSQFPDIQKFGQRWTEACIKGSTPRYEDVVVGNLGSLSEDAAIFRASGQSPDIINVGSQLATVLGWRKGQLFEDLSLNFRRPLLNAFVKATSEGVPQMAFTRSVQGGLILTCELWTFPLIWRNVSMALVIGRSRSDTYNLLESFYRATSEGMLVLSPLDGSARTDYQIVSINNAAKSLLDMQCSSLPWSAISEHLPPRETAFLFKKLEDVRVRQTINTFEFTRHSARSGVLILKFLIVQLGDLLAITISDITMIRSREESVRKLFDRNPIPHILYDPKTLAILKANESICREYGYSSEQLLQMNISDFHPPEEIARAREQASMPRSLNGDSRQWTHMTAGGRRLTVVAYTREIEFEGRLCVLASIVDVTQQREAEARIQHMAHHDHLTNLPNRVLFRARVDEGLCRVASAAQKISILYLDLDGFKLVNDVFGHPVGDKVLREVASRLQGCVRECDMIARLGGDEFAIVQFGILTEVEAGVVAERVIQDLGKPYQIDQQQLQIGVSIGIAIAPAHGMDPDQLLKHADVALYLAKAEGRNTFRIFEPEMDRQIRARQVLEQDLRNALSSGQFNIVYQPLFDTQENRVVACEALLRWHHPEKGMIPPSEFIPIAEETSQIIAIGEWVLLEACREAATWPENIKIAVNLSPVQFRSSVLLSTVMNVLSSSGLDPKRLELEITESVILGENESHRDTLTKLRSLGVSIALDDFGTGYSSLSYLRSFPFDKIKIDRSFVTEIAVNPDYMAIVRAITALGRSLGIRTMAEGVETQAQLEQLTREGLTQFQGYFFSHPQDASTVRAMLDGQGNFAQFAYLNLDASGPTFAEPYPLQP